MPRTTEAALPARFILAPTEPIYRAVRRAGSCKGRERRLGLFRYSLFPAGATPAAVAGPALGSPAAALLAERLARAGVRELLLLSACGSLTPRLGIGDLFIPTGGISEEGTSRLYRKGEIPLPDPARIKRVEEACKCYGVYPEKGLVWTTDAPERETPDKTARFAARGALAVDMEFTALSTLGRFHGIAFAALMIVSDELQEDTKRSGFGRREFNDSLRLGARIARDALGKR